MAAIKDPEEVMEEVMETEETKVETPETEEAPAAEEEAVEEVEEEVEEEEEQSEEGEEAQEEVPEAPEASDAPSAPRRRNRSGRQGSAFNAASVITIERGVAAVTSDTRSEDSVYWHELRNSQLSRKILRGTMSSFERMRLSEESSINVAIVDYHGYRVVIPVSEMNIIVGNSENPDFARQNRIVSNMIGCEVDFIVTALDNKSRSVVASRRMAMERKVADFYFPPAEGVSPVIHEGSIVEARVVAVSETAIRLEAFGAECFVRALDMNNAWIPDARDKYHVGDVVHARITKVNFVDDKRVTIEAEGRSLCPPDTASCAKQGKYLGVVTGFADGVYFLRLNIGLNAIVHSYDGVMPLPQKRDHVAFVCTRMDEKNHVAVGIITKVIRPN